MSFMRYMHIEQLGTKEVGGILDGTVHVFPKLDGANAQVWMEDGQLCCGTRTRRVGDDEQGPFGKLREYVLSHKGIQEFFADPDDRAIQFRYFRPSQKRSVIVAQSKHLRLYGEWLIPHTLKSYLPDAWKKFYVFDVAYTTPEGGGFVHYDTYKVWMEQYGIEYIPCVATVDNANDAILDKLCEQNTYLMKEGIGEGLVIKHYGFQNVYGRTVWAKRVTNQFKYGHYKAMGAPALNGDTVIEDVIVKEYITLGLVNNEYQKLCTAKGDWDSKLIPALLGIVYHCMVTEELWHALKKHKAHQVIDFRVLNRFVIERVKELKPELF